MAKFTFDNYNQSRISAIIAKYPKGKEQSAVLPILDLAQRQNGGFLDHPAIQAVAEILKMPFIKVYEVASFYSMFKLKKVGQYHIQICATLPCMLCNSEIIKQTVEKHLGINVGEITHDNKFSLEEVECLAACVNAPVMVINDVYYENLTPANVIKILNDFTDTESKRSTNYPLF